MLQAINLLSGMYATPSRTPSSALPREPITPPRTRSPFFRKLCGDPIGTPCDTASPSSSSKRAKYEAPLNKDAGVLRRSRRLESRGTPPPTPTSLPRSGVGVRVDEIDTPSKSRRTAKTRAPRRKIHDKTRESLQENAKTVVVPTEGNLEEPVRKIHLIQEKLRYEPWKMLVAVTLLNKTSGRAANPIREEIFKRWPTPQALSEASQTDLAEVLYPLGLFNQRANSLIRLSHQYIQLGWPLNPLSRYPPSTIGLDRDREGMELPESLDVKVFYGAGVYASDSFRIFSPLFEGRGGPEKEDWWLEKRKRAMELHSANQSGDLEGLDGLGVEEVGDWMSDADADDEVEEEWRKVRPLDKELRRYLVWRWGLEGIVYDIHAGPHIRRAGDQRRLSYLLQNDSDV